jgi:hypothetical protein
MEGASQPRNALPWNKMSPTISNTTMVRTSWWWDLSPHRRTRAQMAGRAGPPPTSEWWSRMSNGNLSPEPIGIVRGQRSSYQTEKGVRAPNAMANEIVGMVVLLSPSRESYANTPPSDLLKGHKPPRRHRQRSEARGIRVRDAEETTTWTATRLG